MNCDNFQFFSRKKCVVWVYTVSHKTGLQSDPLSIIFGTQNKQFTLSNLSKNNTSIVFTQQSKMGFSPRKGRNVAPINVTFGTEKTSRLSGQKCGNTAPKLAIWNFGHEFAPQGRLVCNIFTKFLAFVCVYRWLLSFQFGRFRKKTTKL